MRYIEKYLKPGDQVLEVGVGTRRYSYALARQGYTVDAIELVEHNIEVFRKKLWWTKTFPSCRVTLWISRLSQKPVQYYASVRLLYHLYTKEDKQQAIGEAIHVTRQGGKIFVAYVISNGCLLDKRFHRNNINVAEYIKERPT